MKLYGMISLIRLHIICDFPMYNYKFKSSDLSE